MIGRAFDTIGNAILSLGNFFATLFPQFKSGGGGKDQLPMDHANAWRAAVQKAPRSVIVKSIFFR